MQTAMTNNRVATALPDAQPWCPTSPDDSWFMAKVLGVTNATIGDETWPVVHLATIDGDRLVLLGFVREATR